jgi:ribosomal protein L11 methyltransferase
MSDVDEQFDVVVANILAKPLISMAPRLCAYLNSGGPIALSGILAGQVDDVKAAYAPWIDWHDTRHLDDWALICGVRNDRSAE